MGWLKDWWNGLQIVRTTIVGTDSRKSASNMITRGIVGSVFGGIGAIAGMASAKNNTTTTFLIEYANGKRETKTVKNGSSSYKMYIKYLDM